MGAVVKSSNGMVDQFERGGRWKAGSGLGPAGAAGPDCAAIGDGGGRELARAAAASAKSAERAALPPDCPRMIRHGAGG